jgi:hypothetical protein
VASRTCGGVSHSRSSKIRRISVPLSLVPPCPSWIGSYLEHIGTLSHKNAGGIDRGFLGLKCLHNGIVTSVAMGKIPWLLNLFLSTEGLCRPGKLEGARRQFPF